MCSNFDDSDSNSRLRMFIWIWEIYWISANMLSNSTIVIKLVCGCMPTKKWLLREKTFLFALRSSGFYTACEGFLSFTYVLHIFCMNICLQMVYCKTGSFKGEMKICNYFFRFDEILKGVRRWIWTIQLKIYS